MIKSELCLNKMSSFSISSHFWLGDQVKIMLEQNVPVNGRKLEIGQCRSLISTSADSIVQTSLLDWPVVAYISVCRRQHMGILMQWFMSCTPPTGSKCSPLSPPNQPLGTPTRLCSHWSAQEPRTRPSPAHACHGKTHSQGEIRLYLSKQYCVHTVRM